MIDIHCHILPEVDDGAQSWDVAVEMCRMAAEDGITHMVATPHANYQYEYDRAHHQETVRELQTRIGAKPEISLGCDFQFSYDNIQKMLAQPHYYTIRDTKYLLVELSDFSIPPGFTGKLFELMSAGLRPVITHPERNPLLQNRLERVLEWAEQGAIVQVTANALTGDWGKVSQKAARWLLERNAVHVVATDAHDTQHRPPLLAPARQILSAWKSEEIAQALLEDNPGAIIANQELPYFPSPER